MRSLVLVASLLLRSLCADASKGPSNPSRFKAYHPPGSGVLCDADTGPDGVTLWYQVFDVNSYRVGSFNTKTEKFEEFPVPYAGPAQPSTFPGNVTRCIVRTGNDKMIYLAAPDRETVVRVDPSTAQPTITVLQPSPLAGTFTDGWAGEQGIFFTQIANNSVTLLNYQTLLFTHYALPTPQSGPLGIRTDKNNNVWFTNYEGQFISELDPSTGLITEYHDCCPLPSGSFPEVLRASTNNGKYLWASLEGGGLIRIAPGQSHISKKFESISPAHGLDEFIPENDNDYCGRIWYTSPNYPVLVYYDPDSGDFTYINLPEEFDTQTLAPLNEIIIHRGPGPYMWFSTSPGSRPILGRYKLDSSCVAKSK